MTPPAGTTNNPHRARPAPRRAAQRPARRVSGPAGGGPGRRAAAATAGVAGAAGAFPARGGNAAAAPPLALRLGRAVARIGDARFLDRLVRGRAWIALIAAGLMGVVFVQVSMLRLNAGISRAVASAETLQRQNSALRGDISRLDSGERIGDTAHALGMAMPPAGSVHYLDARTADAAVAARGIHPPKPIAGGALAAATTAGSVAPAAQSAATTTGSAGPTAASGAPTDSLDNPTYQSVAPTSESAAPTVQSDGTTSQSGTPTTQSAAPTGQSSAPTGQSAAPTVQSAGAT